MEEKVLPKGNAQDLVGAKFGVSGKAVERAAPAAAENRMLTAALWYGRHGWPVLPCRARGKGPLTEHGLHDATLDAELLSRWWARWPDANLGLAVPAGYVVVDVDGPEGWAALRGAGLDLPATARQQTGRGLHHEHHLYRLPDGVELRNGVGVLPHVDVRAAGGYIVVAPSVTEHPYVWLTPPLRENIADAPSWLLARVGRAGAGVARASGEWGSLVREVPAGRRNATLASVAGHLLRRHVDPEVALALVLAFNAARCRPPLAADEVVVILNSIAGAELRRRGGAR